jgi:hypothetical protein
MSDEIYEDLINGVLFTDKSVFHITDHINRHSCPIWGEGAEQANEFDG